MRINMKLAAFPCALAIAAAAVIVPQVVAQGPAPAPTFKALHKAKDARDKLPKSAASGRFGTLVADADAVRLVETTADGERVYMAPGVGDTICVMATRDGGATTTGGCIERDSIRDGAAFVGWAETEQDDVRVAIPVADAYDQVEVAGQAIAAGGDNLVVTDVSKNAAKVKVKVKGKDVPTLEGEVALGG